MLNHFCLTKELDGFRAQISTSAQGLCKLKFKNCMSSLKKDLVIVLWFFTSVTRMNTAPEMMDLDLPDRHEFFKVIIGSCKIKSLIIVQLHMYGIMNGYKVMVVNYPNIPKSAPAFLSKMCGCVLVILFVLYTYIVLYITDLKFDC